MSFKSKDLVIYALPANGTDDDGAQPDCDATRPPKVYAGPRAEMDLAVLRHQLSERLARQ